MPVLIHKRPEGEIVVHACDGWTDGVESFWCVVDGHYGDSPKNVWGLVEREDEGVLAAFGVAGDVVVLTTHGLTLDPDGCCTVVPKDGDPWPIAWRRRPEDECKAPGDLEVA